MLHLKIAIVFTLYFAGVIFAGALIEKIKKGFKNVFRNRKKLYK